jgi:dihydroxyacetone kinase-like predicted kinase
VNTIALERVEQQGNLAKQKAEDATNQAREAKQKAEQTTNQAQEGLREATASKLLAQVPPSRFVSACKHHCAGKVSRFVS